MCLCSRKWQSGGPGTAGRGQRRKSKTNITLPAPTGGHWISAENPQMQKNHAWQSTRSPWWRGWTPHRAVKPLVPRDTEESNYVGLPHLWTRKPQQMQPGERAKQEQRRGQQRGKRQAQIHILRARYFSGGSLSARAYASERKPLRRKFFQTNSAAQVKTKKKKKKRKRRRLKFDS